MMPAPSRKKPDIGPVARAQDLARLLVAMDGLCEELGRVLREKNECMTRADLDGMRLLSVREKDLTDTLHERNGLRKQLMMALARSVGVDSSAGRVLTITHLATKLPHAEGEALRAAADRLRRTLFAMAQTHRVGAAACREILHHLGSVFASIRPKLDEPVAYTRGGAARGAGAERVMTAAGLFDAVG